MNEALFCCPNCPDGHSPMCINCPVRKRTGVETIRHPEDEEYCGSDEFLDSLESRQRK